MTIDPEDVTWTGIDSDDEVMHDDDLGVAIKELNTVSSRPPRPAQANAIEGWEAAPVCIPYQSCLSCQLTMFFAIVDPGRDRTRQSTRAEVGANGGRIAPRRDRARVCRDVHVDCECGGGAEARCAGGRGLACGAGQGDDGAAAGRTEPHWQ